LNLHLNSVEEIDELTAAPQFLFDGPGDTARVVVLAHGAGAGMETPFMNAFAKGLAERGLRVARFEFPYMSAYRETGKRRPPDREDVLRGAWVKVVKALATKRHIIGGKSMGGRIASLVADEVRAAGLICLGYPFHPVGKPERLRVEHLKTIVTPTLICQGARDPFGTRAEVASYALSPSIAIHWLEDGDHSFKPRAASGRSEKQNWDEAIDKIAAFVETLPT
jgi:hypothetical protein